jgi:hypothetical protein
VVAVSTTRTSPPKWAILISPAITKRHYARQGRRRVL